MLIDGTAVTEIPDELCEYLENASVKLHELQLRAIHLAFFWLQNTVLSAVLQE